MAQIKDNTVKVVFISLLLDLLAFTMILPLLPALLDYYKDIENDRGLYFKILHYVQSARKFFDAPDKVSSVLYGGWLLFFFLSISKSYRLTGINDGI